LSCGLLLVLVLIIHCVPKKPDIVKIAIFSKLVIAYRKISVQYISVIQTTKLTGHQNNHWWRRVPASQLL